MRPDTEPASAQLRKLHEEATPGPWHHAEKGRVFNAHHLVTAGYVVYPEDDPEDETPETLAAERLTERTGEMIALLRNALPALADLAEAVEAEHSRCHGYPSRPDTVATCHHPLCRALAALVARLRAR